jgi:hypothetical protein
LIESEIYDRRCVKSKDLRNDQAANDGDAERLAQLAADSHADGQRQFAEHRGHRCHHDRPEADEAGLVNRFFGTESFVTLRVECEIDLIRDFVLLAERAKGQTETVSHRGLDHADECHFQTGRPP